MPEQQLNALLQQVQALTQGQEQQNAALQQMRQEKEALRAELSVAVARQGELSQELVKAQGALIATQQAVNAAAGADGTIRAAGSSAGYVKHVDVLKAVKQPQSLKEKDQWERFGFQVDAYLALLDAEYPVELEKARKATSPISVGSMQEATADRGRKLFAMLLSWTQELSIAVKSHVESEKTMDSNSGVCYTGSSIRKTIPNH